VRCAVLCIAFHSFHPLQKKHPLPLLSTTLPPNGTLNTGHHPLHFRVPCTHGTFLQYAPDSKRSPRPLPLFLSTHYPLAHSATSLYTVSMNKRTELWDEPAAARIIGLFSAVEGRNIYTHWQIGLPPFLMFGRYGAIFSLKVSAREIGYLEVLISSMNAQGLPKELTWSLAFTVSLEDSMRLSALFSIKGPEDQALRLVGYRHKDNGNRHLSGSWAGGTVRVTEKEFQHLSLLIGAVNEHGLPKGI